MEHYLLKQHTARFGQVESKGQFYFLFCLLMTTITMQQFTPFNPNKGSIYVEGGGRYN